MERAEMNIQGKNPILWEEAPNPQPWQLLPSSCKQGKAPARARMNSRPAGLPRLGLSELSPLWLVAVARGLLGTEARPGR